MPLNLISIVGSFALLIVGANYLVDGACGIARRFGLTDIVACKPPRRGEAVLPLGSKAETPGCKPRDEAAARRTRDTLRRLRYHGAVSRHPSERRTMQTVVTELEALADPSYRDFQAKLVPTVDAARILGVRTPALRRYARAFAHDLRCGAFLIERLPHATYEEMNLHGELIGMLAKTPEQAFEMLDPFLPHIDNWATCDLIKVHAFTLDLPLVYRHIERWVAATGPGSEYVVRFGVVQLMEHFLGDAFSPEHLKLIASINRPEYYINMARAWYLSFALIKQPEATLPLFEEQRQDGSTILDAWTHNKALQKARESRRISPEEKAHLQALKV